MRLPYIEPFPHELPAGEFGSRTQLLSSLGQGIDPVAVMLTCWELGTAPDEIPFANPGEIMVVQNPGAVVAACDTHDSSGTVASLMYGLKQPAVRHLIVCGHTNCTTLAMLVRTGLVRLPSDRFGDRDEARYCDRPSRDWLPMLVQASVLHQLSQLRSHAFVQSRLSAGTLSIHGWIRDDHTSKVRCFDPATGEFCY